MDNVTMDGDSQEVIKLWLFHYYSLVKFCTVYMLSIQGWLLSFRYNWNFDITISTPVIYTSSLSRLHIHGTRVRIYAVGLPIICSLLLICTLNGHRWANPEICLDDWRGRIRNSFCVTLEVIQKREWNWSFPKVTQFSSLFPFSGKRLLLNA